MGNLEFGIKVTFGGVRMIMDLEIPSKKYEKYQRVLNTEICDQ